MLRYAILALVLAAVGAGGLWLGERGARALEGALLQRVSSGLEVVGADWAELRADGLRLELRGHAPDAQALRLALVTARAAVPAAAAPFAAVLDHATVALAPPPTRPPLTVELMRDEGGVVMTGRFAGRPMRAALVRQLRAAAPGLEIRDLTGLNAARPGRGWGPELAVAALAVARLPDAHVRLAPGSVRVGGVAPDAAERDRLTDDLLAAAGDSVRLALDLREPPRAAAPFAFAAVKEPSGGIRAELCHARDDDEAVRLEAALARLGAVAGERRCPALLGGPEGDWVGAVEAGLRALDSLPAGRLRLEYRTALLEGAEDTPPAALGRARAGLADELPAGYALGSAPRVAFEAAPEAAEHSGEPAAFRMRLARTPDGAVVEGLAPGETARRMIESYAEARLGPADLRLALAPDGARAPAGWEPAALVALDALGSVAQGEAELRPGRLRLEGEVAAPGEAGRLHRRMARAAPEGYAVETALTVDLPAAVAKVAPTPGRCAALLDAEIAEAPISFSPGEAVMAPGSGALLDRLAEILERCEGARIEIGGHTDDRGPAELNQRLSRARAEAVLDALLERGVPLGRLAARGYGEDEPVATNATEAGRARNRRIGFRAVSCTMRQAAC